MKTSLALGLLGLVLIAVTAGWYVYSNFRKDAQTTTVDQSGLDDKQLSNLLTQESSDSAITRLRSGGFSQFDVAHYAHGTASVYLTDDGPLLKLENFETNNGPDLFVYLSSNPNIDGIKTNLGQTVSLGALKQLKGDQIYLLPNNHADYDSVVIWCRAFGINFSAAKLTNL